MPPLRHWIDGDQKKFYHVIWDKGNGNVVKVLLDSCLWNVEQIKLIEGKYKAKYVLDACLPGKNGGWANFPVSIFYMKMPHPEGSNYFAFFPDPLSSKLTITNGYEAIKDPINGIMIDETVIYSRYRHDYREYKDVFIDGGRDYVRIGGDRMFEAKSVMIHVKNGEIEVRLKE